MSYGFHSSERIKRRRTKISIHVRSRSHSVTVAPFPRNLHVAACARFGLNLESDRGYLRPCNELSTECSFWQWAALSRGLSRTLTRLPSTRLNCSSITATNISSLFFPILYSPIPKIELIIFIIIRGIDSRRFFLVLFFSDTCFVL